MNKLSIGIIGFALLLGLIGWQHYQVNTLQLKLKNNQQVLKRTQENLEQSLNANQQLLELAQQKQRQARALEQQQQTLQKQYEQQKQQLSEVHHAPENKEWATTDLPGAIEQLRDRPRMYSASDYYQFMQHTQPLPTARASTENQ